MVSIPSPSNKGEPAARQSFKYPDHDRRWFSGRIDSVYVLTGTLCERYIGALPSPSQPFPALPSITLSPAATGRSSSPTAPRLGGTLAAFIMDQDAPRAASFRNYQATVEEIEQRSDLKVWTTLPEADQAALKSIRGQLTKDIDCRSTATR